MNTVFFSPEELDQAASLLKQGKLVAFPTETVYGLGASIFQPQAIQNIFRVKGRPSDNPLIAHVSAFSQIEQIAVDLPQAFYQLAEHFFPGPLTLVVKRHPAVPSEVSANLNSIALRMPSHPIARQLIALTQSPLVAPSANLSGKPSATCSAHVFDDFAGKIEGIVDGGSAEYGIESTVISLLGDTIALLRPGAIKKEQIEEVLKLSIQVSDAHSQDVVLSPGMKYRHYSPEAKVRIFFQEEELLGFAERSECKNVMVLSEYPLLKKFEDCRLLNARDLYSHLRDADRLHYEEIWVLCALKTQNDAALMNRLVRAAGLGS